jgi:hypothetical protein
VPGISLLILLLTGAKRKVLSLFGAIDPEKVDVHRGVVDEFDVCGSHIF